MFWSLPNLENSSARRISKFRLFSSHSILEISLYRDWLVMSRPPDKFIFFIKPITREGICAKKREIWTLLEFAQSPKHTVKDYQFWNCSGWSSLFLNFINFADALFITLICQNLRGRYEFWTKRVFRLSKSSFFHLQKDVKHCGYVYAEVKN